MKILHCCLSCFYVDDFNYQENLLTRQNKIDGHKVKIIASTETFVNSKLDYIAPSQYVNKDGIEVTRLPYRKYIPHVLAKKIRSYPGVYRRVEEFAPDVILFHGMPAFELLTLVDYKRKNPGVKLYVDSHEDSHNSATNFLSKQLLHKIFYRTIIQRALPYIDKVLCFTYESFDFLRNIYGIPDRLMEYFPLGGTVLEENVRLEKRERIRNELQLKESDILIVHSGKMDKLKRTEELLEAFLKVKHDHLRLILIGSLPEGVKENVTRMIESDFRASYHGWKSGEELIDYLCASDLYLQPGTQSATMQNALCSGSSAAVFPYPSHKYLLNDTVFYIETVQDMIQVLESIANNPQILESKRAQTKEIACKVLDYKVLAARLYR
ncbi:glycosyltransferase family 4 protein [Paenibacillus sp. TRM 82003]|nr:glycosyltransferase family 4 protein [Paenibacillus sp. TRM 82003]